MGRWRQVGCWPGSSPHVEFQDTKRPCLKQPGCMASDTWGWFLASTCIHTCMHPHTPEYACTAGHGCLWVLVNHLFSYSKDVLSWRLLGTHCLDQSLQQARGELFHPMIRVAGEQLVTSPAAFVIAMSNWYGDHTCFACPPMDCIVTSVNMPNLQTLRLYLKMELLRGNWGWMRS